MSTPTVESINKIHTKPLKELTLIDSGEIIHWSLDSLTYYMYGVDHTHQALCNVKKCMEYLSLVVSYLVKWQVELKVDGVNSKGMVLNDIQYLLKEKPKCIK